MSRVRYLLCSLGGKLWRIKRHADWHMSIIKNVVQLTPLKVVICQSLLKAVDLVTVKQQYNYGNKSSLTLKADSLSDLNQVLESLLYSNTLYEPKGAIDIITLVYRSSRALIPVQIIYQPQALIVT